MAFDFDFDSSIGLVTIAEGSTEVPDEAFQSRSDVQSVTIPDSVTSIGDDSFKRTSLLDVVIPKSVTSIGKEAFYASKLATISLGEAITSIGNVAFSNNDLKKVDIGDSVTTIGTHAFANNVLTDVVIGNSVSSIGDYAFRGNNLAAVVIPDSVISLGDFSFADNNLTNVSLPKHFKANPPVNAFDSGVTLSYPDDDDSSTQPEPLPESVVIPDSLEDSDSDVERTRGELTKEGWTSSEDSGSWSVDRDAASEFNDIEAFSLSISKGVTVKTLSGNDKLIAKNDLGSGLEVKGNLSMGGGDDLIDIRVTNSFVGIENSGKINMGTGNDAIISSTRNVAGGDIDALINHKSINMGAGDDVIDASAGALGGIGKIMMGKGNDLFAGFGDMKLIDGGKGVDKLQFDRGVYSVTLKGSKYRIAKGKGSADFTGFELVGSLWSRDDEFIPFDFNKKKFAMIVDEHSVLFI